MVCGAVAPGGKPVCVALNRRCQAGVSAMRDDVTAAVRIVSRDALDPESLALGVAEC